MSTDHDATGAGPKPDGTNWCEQGATVEMAIGTKMSTQGLKPSASQTAVNPDERAKWMAARSEAFRIAASGASLDLSLDCLVKAVREHTYGDARCAFYVVDVTGTTLHHVTGMPAKYAQCVDGFKVSRDSLACGLAVYSAQPVITPDVTKESRWQRWLWLAEEYGYRGCWSFPLETPTGKVVGTLAMYFAQPREATPRDREFAMLMTQAAGMIVSQYREAEEWSNAR